MLHEQLSEQFYNWELRGRGWQIYSEPVYPEPPFVPFTGHYPQSAVSIDDGHRPTALSSFVQRISRALASNTPARIEETQEEPEPELLLRDSLVEFQTALPADLDTPKEALEQFLLNLSRCQEPIAFELLGTHKLVTAQFAAHPNDAGHLHRQLGAYFPDALFQRKADTLMTAWNASAGEYAFAAEFGLEHEFMLPLSIGKFDAFVGIVGALSELEPQELALFQVLFQRANRPWAESIKWSVTHEDGRPFFINAPELTDGAKIKTAKPLYAAVVRMLVRSPSFRREVELGRSIGGALSVFMNPHGNALKPLSNDEYPFEEHIADVLYRQSRRTGMLLNSDELIGFVHLPSSAVRSSVLQRDVGKTKAAPDVVAQGGGVLIGTNEHAGETVEVRLSADQRVQHTHIIGASGTGKSTLLLNLILQDIERGDGVAVLDPHGDLIDGILGVIPDSRINDVVVVDPSDDQYPVGFNILSAHSDREKTLIASDLVSIFRRLSTSWGDQIDTVLQNTILAILESSRGGTLAELRRFLMEDDFRREFLRTVGDPEIVYYWQKVFPRLAGGKSVGPVLTRLQGLMSQKPLRNMVSQFENKLNFAEIMDRRKIFLARLPEGLFGAENSYMLGTLLVAKFQQVAMSRQEQEFSARRDFWLYIDEFDHFITPTMAEILKGARKYRLGLTLAHQELHQLKSDAKVASAVMTHPLTRIVFRVGDDDAKQLAGGFSFFKAENLKNLETFHAIARVERSDYDFNLTIEPPQKLDRSITAARRAHIISLSRQKYGKPRAEVERKIFESLGLHENAAAVVDSPHRPKSTRPPTQAQPAQSPSPAPPPAPTKSAEPQIPAVPAQPLPPLPKPPEQIATDTDDGNSEHESLKNQIRTEAEVLDFTASPVEKHFPAIKARADVVLERGADTFIVQISVTTPPEFEAESIRKFLKLDVKHIALVCKSRKKSALIQELLSETHGEVSKVGFYTPTQFIEQLNEWAEADPDGGSVERDKPKKRSKLSGSAELSEEERQQNEEIMLREIAERMKKKKPDPPPNPS